MSGSRRSHTRAICLITKLSSLGTGKEKYILTALDTHALAMADRSTVLIVDLDGSEFVKIRPEMSPIEAEFVTAVEWLVFSFNSRRVLAVGTSAGSFMLFSVQGLLIHKQIVHPGRILRLRVRGTNTDLIQQEELDASSEEISIVMPGVIARFHGSHIQTLLNRWFQETHSQFSEDDTHSQITFGTLPYQLWNVSKYGTCADAAITGLMPPPLMELQSSQRYYCAVTIGDDAVISAYRLSEDRGRSLVGAILSKVVPATFSTIASFSKLIWRSDPKSAKKPQAKPQPFARASPLTCLKDHPRKGEKLTLSPSGTLAAITDSLGRILLLDTQALVVVRLWKGYREASCLFMEMLMNKDTTTCSSAYNENVKGDYCLCLAIHAPRKEIIEVWQMRTGPRLLTIPCARGSKILQPTYRFESSSSTSHSYVPLEVFILNGDSGQLSVINRSLK